MKLIGTPKVLQRKRDLAGPARCVNRHRTEDFDGATRRLARDRVAPVSTLRYR